MSSAVCPLTHFLYGLLLVNLPRRDEALSWYCWLTDSRQLNHTAVTRPAGSLMKDEESSPVETSVLTTMLCRQFNGSALAK